MYNNFLLLRSSFPKAILLATITVLCVFQSHIAKAANLNPTPIAYNQQLQNEQPSEYYSAKNTSITEVTVGRYVTTTGHYQNDGTSQQLDQNIILSMLCIILIGFATLFSAVGYQRSKS